MPNSGYMKILYVTDKKQTAETLAELLNCTFVPEHNYFQSSNEIIVFIQAKYNIQLNGTGRKLYTFDDGIQKISVTVDYSAYSDIKTIKDIIQKEEGINIVNICSSNPSGQLNFEILATCTGINSDDCKRVWLTTNKTDRKLLKDAIKNSNYKSEGYAKLAEILIDRYWQFRSKQIFGYEADINIKEMMLLNMLENKEKSLDNDNTKDREYYRVNAEVEEKTFRWHEKSKGDKIATLDEAEQTAKDIREKQVFITKINRRIIKKEHPLLYNSSDLYIDIQKKKLFEINEVKSVLEKLHTYGYITNPSTDSRHLPVHMASDLFDVLKALKTIPQYFTYINYIKAVNETINVTRRIVNDDLVDNNYAIIPTTTVPMNHKLIPEEYAVYDLIVRRFLTAFMGDIVTENLTIYGYIDEGNSLKYEETMLVNEGWSLAYDDKSDINEVIKSYNERINGKRNTEDDIQAMERYDIKSVYIERGNPRGKTRYTLTALINLMANCGKNIKDADQKAKLRHLSIGMPSDRNQIIDDLLTKGYIELDENNKVYVTDAAEQLLASTPKDLLSLQLLESFNMRIKAIQQKREDIKTVLREHASYLTKLIEDKENEHNPFKIIDYNAIIEDYVCPYCDSKIADRGKFLGCKGYPGCEFSMPKIYLQYTLTEKDFRELIENGITDWITGFTFSKGPVRKGRARLKLNEKRKLIPWFE